MLCYFYPRSPRGERRFATVTTSQNKKYFYPRSPRGERQHSRIFTPAKSVFLSTLPARGATATLLHGLAGDTISIHAPREGSDDGHLPTGGPNHKFLSTLPARGATLTCMQPYGWTQKFLSTLPARGATKADVDLIEAQAISIHAPREGSDLAQGWHMLSPLKFLSTLPARGATALD